MTNFLIVFVLTVVLGDELLLADRTPGPCDGGSCYPDIGDLLVGREDRLTATSTCGQKKPENYCIVSHLRDEEKCFVCEANVTAWNHDIRNVITTFRERLGTWWQSENGLDDVSIRLDLETAFHFTHLIMTFKTFRPAAMLIERSNDYGKTWRVYRYFAYDCSEFFPNYPQFPPRELDEVICDSRYSLIEPSTEGEVIYKVLEPSLIGTDDPYSTRIQDLLTITNLRINFTHMHTLGDDLLDTRENIKDKYYYSLYELIVRGNCFCYGHADECHPIDASLARPDLVRRDLFQVNGKCVCQHNTQGLNCDECIPFFHDRPWKPADRLQPNECKRCNCNDHANECHFDPAVWEATSKKSGGVCDSCRDNTMGHHCELCKPFYYHHPERDIRDPHVCSQCDCEVAGSLNSGLCDGHTDPGLGMIAGQCRCKVNVEGERCDQCRPGYYNLDENNVDGCTSCDCEELGTLDNINQCNAATGQCICKRQTTGKRCDKCKPETWGLSGDSDGCSFCDCDVGGAYDNHCEKATGQCNCRPHMTGRRCDTAEDGFFIPLLDHYLFEAEDAFGNENTNPYNQMYHPPMMWTGYGFRMVHEDGVIEFTVSGLPESMEYDFILRYVPYTGQSLDNVHVSIIRPNAGNIPPGSPCDNTKPGDDKWVVSLRGHPTSFENLGPHCLEMNYDYIVRFEFPDGNDGIGIDSLVLVANYSGIVMFHGSIEGTERSREFDELQCQRYSMQLPKSPQNEICASLVLSMNAILHDGALACDCDLRGSESSICTKNGGQCRCKPNVMGRQCNLCVPGTFDLGPDGCKGCDCDAEGSLKPDIQYCNTTTGQCTCRSKSIAGRRCDVCKQGFYDFPGCRPCNCNGHAKTCDPFTGRCISCLEHTIGDNCERCKDGYYGDATLGSSNHCKPCMCPGGPGSGRQFATTCMEAFNPQTSLNQVTCDCSLQYTGETCSQCSPGHYGNPQEFGGICIACDCNGNVDSADPNACDARTGECTGCLYDTAGQRCEVCKLFYFGDALAKDCRACDCDIDGTSVLVCEGEFCHCDFQTGQCPCLPNMTGRRCDSCLPNHFRGSSGEGCIPCDCYPLNSVGSSCDEHSGKCACKDGFGGRTCRDCADGFWGNPDIQCQECNCDPLGSADTQCDRLTGECVCIDGVGGRYCDRCERGFTGEIPECLPCGECFDNWDDIISDIKKKTENIISHARAVEETGINGAYEDDFGEIEALLYEIKNIISSLDAASAEDNFPHTIENLRDRLAVQEIRLDKLERDMEKLRNEDADITARLNEQVGTLNDVKVALRQLQEDTSNISKTSPAAAYKQVEDAADRSEKADLAAKAASIDEGSLVEQSRLTRLEVEEQLASKLAEFGDKRTQVEEDLNINQDKVEELSLAELNENICGAATEDCDATCGGAGCGHCGGLSCGGAVTNADEGVARAMKTKQILDALTADANDLRLRIEVTKKSSEEAKAVAEDAKAKADEVEAKVKARNQKIRKLIHDIKKFLTVEKSRPEEIKTLAQEVLEMSLSADSDEIDQRAASIRNLVNSLPDVDEKLAETQSDLDTAKKLFEDAKNAQARASELSLNVKDVQRALEEAENATELARGAIADAKVNIDFATIDINNIVKIVRDVMNDGASIKQRIDAMDEKLTQIEMQIIDNRESVEAAVREAETARDVAQASYEKVSQSLNNSTSSDAIGQKRNEKERLLGLQHNVEFLENQAKAYMKRLQDLDGKFDEQEKLLGEKNDELDRLLAEVEDLYGAISDKEKIIRKCS